MNGHSKLLRKNAAEQEQLVVSQSIQTRLFEQNQRLCKVNRALKVQNITLNHNKKVSFEKTSEVASVPEKDKSTVFAKSPIQNKKPAKKPSTPKSTPVKKVAVTKRRSIRLSAATTDLDLEVEEVSDAESERAVSSPEHSPGQSLTDQDNDIDALGADTFVRGTPADKPNEESDGSETDRESSHNTDEFGFDSDQVCDECFPGSGKKVGHPGRHTRAPIFGNASSAI